MRLKGPAMEEDDDEKAAIYARYFRRRWLNLQQCSLLLPPLSPYREPPRAPCTREEMSDALNSGDIFELRKFRLWWNKPLCTETQPGYGDIYTTLQLAVVRGKECLASYMLLDPLIDLRVLTIPGNKTTLMIAAGHNCSVGLARQLLRHTLVQSGSNDFLNAVDVNGKTALDCASYLGPIYLMFRRYGALHASELREVEDG